MAAVEITISGVLYDKYNRTQQNVVLFGEASLTGLQVGGGPSPGGPGSGAGGEPPLGIWGPPTMPPGFWGGGMGPGVKPQPPAGAHPDHTLPGDLPQQPPQEPIQPPVEWKAVWAGPEHGWVVVGVPSGEHVTPSQTG
jgi:hypothetical protein